MTLPVGFVKNPDDAWYISSWCHLCRGMQGFPRGMCTFTLASCIVEAPLVSLWSCQWSMPSTLLLMGVAMLASLSPGHVLNTY